MLKWVVGNTTITQVVETLWPISPRYLFAEVTRDMLADIAWLKPAFVDDENRMLLSIHTLIVESQGERIMVDTCLGNDKEGRYIEEWNRRSGGFLTDIADAGFPADDIDTVLCTHMHVDHVGWSTTMIDGSWVPTFSNARYLYARDEWDAVRREADSAPEIADSVMPIFDAGKAVVVDNTHQVTDEVWLEPTPGHTPGHVSVHIRSKGEEAVITGDMTHHPCQFSHPEWCTRVDHDQDLSIATRGAFYERYADTPVLIIGTHFAAPTAGRIVRDGDTYRLDC